MRHLETHKLESMRDLTGNCSKKTSKISGFVINSGAPTAGAKIPQTIQQIGNSPELVACGLYNKDGHRSSRLLSQQVQRSGRHLP